MTTYFGISFSRQSRYTGTEVQVQMSLEAKKNMSSEISEQQRPDQPAYLHSPINTFVIFFLESIISKLATSEISIF